MRISDWSSDVCSSDLLVTLPDGIMALVLPTEARDMPGIWSWLEKMVAGNGPIRKLVPVDVRQSMANGGGPACLRLRVVADPAHIDPRSAERRVGKEFVSTCISRWAPLH